jgi:hypothetical protein
MTQTSDTPLHPCNRTQEPCDFEVLYGQACERADNAERSLAKANADREALEADARRYRWLVNNGWCDQTMKTYKQINGVIEEFPVDIRLCVSAALAKSDKLIDAAIDAALAKAAT